VTAYLHHAICRDAVRLHSRETSPPSSTAPRRLSCRRHYVPCHHQSPPSPIIPHFNSGMFFSAPDPHSGIRKTVVFPFVPRQPPTFSSPEGRIPRNLRANRRHIAPKFASFHPVPRQRPPSTRLLANDSPPLPLQSHRPTKLFNRWSYFASARDKTNPPCFTFPVNSSHHTPEFSGSPICPRISPPTRHPAPYIRFIKLGKSS